MSGLQIDEHHEYEYLYIDNETGQPKEAGRHSLSDFVDPLLWPDYYVKPHISDCSCAGCREAGVSE